MGYGAHVESGPLGCRNIVIGNPGTADYVISAHYDTCGLLPGLNGVIPCSILGLILFSFLRILILLLIPCLFACIFLCFHHLWVEISAFSGALILTGGLLIFFRINPFSTENDSSGLITLLEIAAGLQKIHRSKVCFLLFDGKEAGFSGSRSYVKAHGEAMKTQISVNLDSVGRGDRIFIFPGNGLKTDASAMANLYSLCGYYGKKQITLLKKGFYPSDYLNFPKGAGICAGANKSRCLFLRTSGGRKNRDMDETNVNLLRAAILSMVSCGAVK